MSDRVYVVVADTGRVDMKVQYAGTDKNMAFNVCDIHTDYTGGRKSHAFVKVFEGGEHQFDTRDRRVLEDG